MSAVRARHFPDTDTLYIELADRPSVASEEGPGGVVVHLDAEGRPVGVTVDGWRDSIRSNTRISEV